MSWCYQRLPWPAGVVFRPLLMTPGDDLGGRVVVLVTDQIWTIGLAMFLNNCHSTWGDGRQPLLNRSGYTALSSLSGRSVRKVSVRVKRGNLLLKVCAKSHHRILTVNSIPCKTGLTEREEVIAVFETELEGGGQSVFPDALGGVIHVSVFLPCLLLQPAATQQFFLSSLGLIRKWFSPAASSVTLSSETSERRLWLRALGDDDDAVLQVETEPPRRTRMGSVGELSLPDEDVILPVLRCSCRDGAPKCAVPRRLLKCSPGYTELAGNCYITRHSMYAGCRWELMYGNSVK